MGDAMRKVQAGQPMAIPAAAYNSFIDAAADYQSRQQSTHSKMSPTGPQANRITVRNDSSYDLVVGTALGFGDPIITPDDNLEEFKSRIVLSVVLPTVAQHSGRFVVLAEPIGQNELGQAYIHGACPAFLDVQDETHGYADITADFPLLQTNGGHGAEIIWKQSGTGLKWGILRLSKYSPPSLFPVILSQAGGEQGSSSSGASWTYDVTDVVTDSALASGVNPTVSPHRWKRPSVGQMSSANFGYAHYDATNQLVLGWINEMVIQTACS